LFIGWITIETLFGCSKDLIRLKIKNGFKLNDLLFCGFRTFDFGMIAATIECGDGLKA